MEAVHEFREEVLGNVKTPLGQIVITHGVCPYYALDDKGEIRVSLVTEYGIEIELAIISHSSKRTFFEEFLCSKYIAEKDVSNAGILCYLPHPELEETTDLLFINPETG